MAVAEGDFDAIEDLIAAGEVKRDAGEGGAHFKTPKAGGAGGGFAGFEDCGADAASSEIGMDKEGADFGGVGGGIEEFGFADSRVVGAEEGFAFAPAAAAGKMVGTSGAGFGDEVSAVDDELGVEAKDGAEGTVDLFGGVVVLLQRADGGFDELMEGGNVGRCSQAEGEIEVGAHKENRTGKRAEYVTRRRPHQVGVNRAHRENEEYKKQEDGVADYIWLHRPKPVLQQCDSALLRQAKRKMRWTERVQFEGAGM